MRTETKIASLVIGWLLMVTVSIVLGLFVHLFFAGVALGSIATIIILQKPIQWGTKMIAGSTSQRTDEMLAELKDMKDN